MYQRIQALPCGGSQNLPVFCGNPLLRKHFSPDSVINIMINICNFIGKADYFPFHCRRHKGCLVVQHPVPYLPGQVQPLPILFQNFHNTDALHIMPEPIFAKGIEHMLPCMSKWSMPQIMPKGNSLHQILIQPESLCNCAGILGYLQCMGQPGPVMVPPRR